MTATLLFAMIQIAAPPAVEPPGAEVVVVARRGRCSVAVADRIISDRAFRARAKEWADGTPVRISVADRSDYRCLARIMFRLRSYGVTRAEFVGPGPR